MKISLHNQVVFSKNCSPKKDEQTQATCTAPNKSFNHDGMSLKGNYNKAFISFKGYYGNQQPAKKLFWILSGTNDVYENNYTNSHLYNGGNTGWKKWVELPPEELLKFNPKDSVEAICSLNKQPNCYPGIPSFIPTPNYGDKWGRRANYIEMNPRTIANTKGDRKSEGLLNMIKLLPAIPPSPKSFANCVILSQLYPCINNDGKVGDSSLYTMNLKSGISKNLTSDWLGRGGEKMGDDEMVRAFNDLAHMRGLKTGMRMLLSADQMWVQGRKFDWNWNQEDYIQSCCDAVDMGFDAIYFDSAKHVGNYDMGDYQGVGNLPNYQQMQYITQQIKARTGRNDIALIGEKCDKDAGRYKEMGMTAGTDWSQPDKFDSVLYEYDQQRYSDEYAAGPDISNDNDRGGMPFEQRLNRVKNAFNGYRDPGYKLPSFMQMADIFPPTPYTNTHDQMLYGQNHSTYGDSDSHYNNLFNHDGRWLTHAVYNEFANVMYQ